MSRLSVAPLTLQHPGRRLYAANQTTANFPALPLAMLASPPSGDGYFGEGLQNHLVLGFFGTGADNATMNARVSGVKRVFDRATPNASTAVWMRVPLFTALCTLGQMVGLASKFLTASERMADTVVPTGDTKVLVFPDSVLNQGMQLLQFDVRGFDDVFVEVDRNTASATDVNALAWSI